MKGENLLFRLKITLKKTISFFLITLLILSFTGCSSRKEYTPPNLNNLSPEEQKLYEDFQSEVNGTMTKEEKAQLRDDYDYIAAIARDIAKKYIMVDSDKYHSLEIENMGNFLREGQQYTRIDLNADDVYVKSILVDINNDIFKLYDKNKDKVEDFEYNHIGNFVRNLGPWVSDEQKLVNLNNTTPQRVGTSIDLYRELENNELHIAIQTYLGFENIANVIVPVKLENKNELTFTFTDDGYGHSGKGKLIYNSEDNMTLIIESTTNNEFGIYNGTLNLVKNKV